MEKMHNIQSVSFEQESMIIKINGLEYKFDLNHLSSKLLNATSQQRNEYQISPANYGIHWPLIDEDISVKQLMEH
ncbi:MAG: DUF2442 domain-containing protein [Sediminibacterium sp.]|nr:DUF2442 domain-containing protein [Sediminibacterium sp.]